MRFEMAAEPKSFGSRTSLPVEMHRSFRPRLQDFAGLNIRSGTAASVFYVVSQPDGSSSVERISVLGGEAKKDRSRRGRSGYIRAERMAGSPFVPQRPHSLWWPIRTGNEAAEIARAGGR
jgi:hypothetical protein